jgi:cellulose synthase/poly-beta-1,6-N-acetylglucosamine synthase-like glycosyltransferase
VPGAEPLELIEHALKALVAIRYPHDTWLLDEGNDPAARALCERLGVRHFSRRDIAQYQAAEGAFRSATKHGNYNAWLHDAGHGAYDILSAFDADHVPHPEYLDQLLGYFRDPSIGYVQPAQAYYNQRASFHRRRCRRGHVRVFLDGADGVIRDGFPHRRRRPQSASHFGARGSRRVRSARR